VIDLLLDNIRSILANTPEYVAIQHGHGGELVGAEDSIVRMLVGDRMHARLYRTLGMRGGQLFVSVRAELVFPDRFTRLEGTRRPCAVVVQAWFGPQPHRLYDEGVTGVRARRVVDTALLYG